MMRCFALRICMLSLGALSCVRLCVAMEISADWASGELWKLERGPKWGDVEMSDADAHTSHAAKGSIVTFDDLFLHDIELTWKETSQPKEKKEGTTQSPEKKSDAGEKAPNAPPAEANGGKKAGKLNMLTCDIFNRLNDGDMPKADYDKQLKQCVDVLTRVSGAKAVKLRMSSGSGTTKQEGWQWETEHGAARVIHAVTSLKGEQKKEYGGNKRPEYIRLLLAAKSGDFSTKAGHRDLHDFVKKDTDGTVWIEGIPMVDQGNKKEGYCVPATLARLLSYYGISGADMATLIALCNSTAEGGTSFQEIEDAVRTIAKQYHLKLKQLSCPYTEHLGFLKDYNAAAKKAEKAELSPEDPGNMNWLPSVNPKVWLAVRAKKKSEVNKWFNSIREHVDSGVPVLWIVFASNLYGDDKKSSEPGGGHIRLIIGYNQEKKQVIYSDSWGEWAARRVMTSHEAYAVTSSTYIVK